MVFSSIFDIISAKIQYIGIFVDLSANFPENERYKDEV